MKLDFKNKRIVIIGAGRSGLALVRFLVDRGASVALSDLRTQGELEGLDSLQGLPVQLDLSGHRLELFERADFIAVSPGVPLDIEPLRHAVSCGVPLLGEIEIAALEISAPIIGVTGTNGKSTTTSLIGEILHAWGKKIFVGGNLGTPLIQGCSEEIDGAVVELSSFQLETIDQFHPAIGLLLNLSSDHLDRYPDLDSYYQAKLRLFSNMTAADYAVLNADDEVVCRLTADVKATKVWFSSQGRPVEGMVKLKDKLVWNWAGANIQLPLSELQISGEHNIENAMAAMIPPLLQGCPAELAWGAVCSFTGLKHRMQLVRKLDGVSWYNDSKGTNVGSVLKSLSGLPCGVTLIAGGKDKGGDYSLLKPLLEQQVEHLLLIGEAAEKMAAELSGSCEISLVAGLEAAVQKAYDVTAAGGTVLLSPACSSFDMFRNYQVRGDDFETLVRQLPEERTAS
ncbi:MAG: UDP-N-acetylmuramoyl-L-alanine--D-glutamate ligase [Desulfuromusa sp.]|nr:UDP-N-acetylmuramoyl-L-alanine--D-glutamate ligase [Desulfuromusa sp.]